jgi:hypothetical protein
MRGLVRHKHTNVYLDLKAEVAVALSGIGVCFCPENALTTFACRPPGRPNPKCRTPARGQSRDNSVRIDVLQVGVEIPLSIQPPQRRYAREHQTELLTEISIGAQTLEAGELQMDIAQAVK